MDGADPLTSRSWLGGAVRLVHLSTFDDARGSLVPIGFEEFPFTPRRSFIVHDVPVGTTRGGHALIEQQQVLVCGAGCIEVEVRRGGESADLALDRPEVGLFIDSGVWSSQRFVTEGAILLGFASGTYDPAGYADDVAGG